MEHDSCRYPGAFIAYANYAPFAPGRTVRLGPVQSRMLLWCKTGKGIVAVNGNIYDFRPGNFLFLPWNHMIRYQADRQEPFMVAGIHIIPNYSGNDEVIHGVFHNAQPGNSEYIRRKDIRLEGFADVFCGRLNESSRLLLLAEYIVNWFKDKPQPRYFSRTLAESLIYELERIRANPQNTELNLPVPLYRVRLYIEKNIAKNPNIDTLSRVAACSRSTLFRLFQQHFQCSPGNWLLRRRMECASEMLTKSGLRVGEIGSRVGIDDPYYFSRLFKKYHGASASEYRRRNLFDSNILAH